MPLRTLSLLIYSAAILWCSSALAQSTYLEGHVFNKRSGAPIEGAVVVMTENISLGPVPILLAETVTDSNGFYQASVSTAFPVGIIEVFCRTRNGLLVRGGSSAPLQDDVIRRRDIYLETPRWLRGCLDPEPGDVPRFRD